MGEGRVVPVHFDHREQGRQRLTGRQKVSELLFDDVADHRLGLRAEHIQGVRGDFVVRRGLQRQQPHLRPVTVRDHELVPRCDSSDCRGGHANVVPLIFSRHGLAPAQNRVATQCDDDTHGRVRTAPTRGRL